MPGQPTPIPFPVKGLDENWPYAQQPEGTTSDCLNVRAYDATLGRLRGGRRPGMSKWYADEINSGNKIKDLNVLTASVPVFTATEQVILSGDVVSGKCNWLLDTSDGTLNDDYYHGSVDDSYHAIADQDGYIYIGNNDVSDNIFKINDTMDTISWDYDAGTFAYQLTFNKVTGYLIAIGNSNTDEDGNTAAVRCFNPNSGELLWHYDLVDGALDVDTDSQGNVYVAHREDSVRDPNIVLTKLSPEGEFIWRWGTALNNDARCIHISKYDEILLGTNYTTSWDGGTGEANLFNLNVDGEVQWTALISDGDALPQVSACIWLNDGNIVVGTQTGSADIALQLLDYNERSIIRSWDIGGTAANEVEGMDLDNNGNLYIITDENPNDWEGAGGNTGNTFKFDSDLIFQWYANYGTGGLHGISVKNHYSLPPVERRTALSILSDDDINIIEGGAISTPTGGSAALAMPTDYTASDYPPMSQPAWSGMYFVDGINNKLYRMQYNDVVSWTAETGVLPQGARLISLYRGRMVLSGVANDPHNWFLSKSGDPNNWDYSPSALTPIQAVAGNNSDLGLIGDVVTGLVPFSDDVLIFGGDHTLWAMTGDPAAGGNIDLISDTIGMAFGRAWAKDPNNTIYFLSTDGVYRMPPKGFPENMTESRIKRRIEDIDLNANHVRLYWDFEQEGLYVLVIKKTTLVVDTVLFWESRTDAWWIDGYPSAFGPSSMLAYNSDDPEDSALLFGCLDGFIRKVDTSANTDDTIAVASRVKFGPMVFGEAMGNFRISEMLPIMGQNSADVILKIYAGDTAEELAAASSEVVRRTLTSGRNASIRHRIAANALGIELSTTSGGPWSFSSMTVYPEPAGKVKRLSR